MSLLPALFYHDFFEPLAFTRYHHDPWHVQLKSKSKSSSSSSSSSDSNSNTNALTNDMKSILEVDLVETENEFQIYADLPGVEEKDLDISIENNHLVIKGHREKKHEVKNSTEHRIERSYGTVQRSIRLPPNADQSSCQANLENGVLKVSLTKTAPRPSANKIPITMGKKTITSSSQETA